MAEDENSVVTDETPQNAEYDEELCDENYEEMDLRGHSWKRTSLHGTPTKVSMHRRAQLRTWS